ncbi:hypothetical protein [Corynebacterium aquatimens]|uniref:Uncharacterized protein n=1 Tax=Corynebacterium aquatimens TaxID=1190508 RepID=A0A931GWA7_9CORY|nr:hypothetical protein [Corynebacterium aquatimens]MBG6122341.1 hypothetical protein [Corynebacterium aquatimens]WJY65116.1 Rossmann-like domain protein [Corynebacterium aquatimens]
MPGPRLRVGIFGGFLDKRFEQAGHTVVPIQQPGDITQVDLVVVGPVGVEETVVKLVPFIRPGQMVLHTALEFGVQVLDPLETEGAIVMAAHNFFDDVWVTSAADEVGEAAVNVLITDLGETAYPIEDHARPMLEAVRMIRTHESSLRIEAAKILTEALPDAKGITMKYYFSVAPPDATREDPESLDRMYAAIKDPQLRKAFVDLMWLSVHQGSIGTEPALWALDKQSEFGPLD